MSVTISCGNVKGEIGSASFFTAFFSTIVMRLENGRWGSRFPVIMRELYSGAVAAEHSAAAVEELRTIRSELARFPPDQVVWTYENLTARPPWGNDISPHIRDLSNYFVTSAGRDLIELLEEVFAHSAKDRLPVAIR